jgi:glutathione peroxidase
MKKLFLTLIISIIPMFANAENTVQNAYDFSFNALEAGKEIKLEDYKGKVLLVVNTACLCGFTPQFSELEKLYLKYKDKGLVIIGVPSNDFGGQELENETKVKDYLDKNFTITFPLTRITKIKGDEAHPFFKWASDKAGILGRPKWNFYKYLISKNGEFIEWYASTTTPDSKKLKKAIETELQK